MTEVVFLPEDGETANNRLARYTEELLGPGPMTWVERADVMRAFLSSTFTNGMGAWKTKGTTCALFLGGSLIGSGCQARRPIPRIFGITTWLKASWFSGAEWIPYSRFAAGETALLRGDIPYYCGNREPNQSRLLWQAAFNGHVVCLRNGEGWNWTVAQGGGANGRCALNDTPSDIRISWNRYMRGVWRPNLMAATELRMP